MPNYTTFQYGSQYQQPTLHCGKFILHQLGELNCDPGYKLGEHVQHCYEFCYVVSGKATFIIDDVFHIAKANDLVLLRAGERHAMISSTSEPVRYFYVSFAFSRKNEDGSHYARLREYLDNTEHPIAKDYFNVYTIYNSLFTEVKFGDDYVWEVLEAGMTQLCVAVYRNFVRAMAAAEPKEETPEDSIIYNIMYLIDTNITSIDNLADIGKKLGYSYSYLSHLFTRKTGKSIKMYYRQKLFEKAVELLEQNINITEVARRMGYETIHSFSRAFSNYFGYPPTEYMKKEHGRDRLAKGSSGGGGHGKQ